MDQTALQQKKFLKAAQEEWGTAASTFVYFTQLLPSGGAFLAEMAGQQIGLNGSAKKLVQKRPVGGTKCVK